MSLKYNNVTLRSDFPGEIDTPTYVSDLDVSTFPKAKHYQELLDYEKYEEAETYLNSSDNADLRKCISSAKLLNELQDRICAAQVTINARNAKQEIMMQQEKPSYINQNTGKFWIEEIGEDSDGKKYGRLYVRTGENLENSEYTDVTIEPGTRKEGTEIGKGSFIVGEQNIAKGNNQTVIGKFNKSDSENKCAFIIGGGSSDSNRKNIMTVDWDGNLNIENDIILKDKTKLSEKQNILTKIYEVTEVDKIDIDFLNSKNLLPLTDSSLISGSFSRISDNQSLKNLPELYRFLTVPNSLFHSDNNSDLIGNYNCEFVLNTFYYGGIYKQELSLYLDGGLGSDFYLLNLMSLERVTERSMYSHSAPWTLSSFSYFNIMGAVHTMFSENIKFNYAYVENGFVNISINVNIPNKDTVNGYNGKIGYMPFKLFAPRKNLKVFASLRNRSIETIEGSSETGSSMSILSNGDIYLNLSTNGLGYEQITSGIINCDYVFNYPLYLH